MKALALIFDAVTRKVREECEEKRISGVFVMGNTRSGEIHYAVIGLRISTQIDVPDTGNIKHLCSALEKYAFCATHLKDSGIPAGTLKSVYGEISPKGGVIESTKEFVYSFSGAKAEVNLELALAALLTHRML